MSARIRPGKTVRLALVLFVARLLLALAIVLPVSSIFSHLLRGFGGDGGMFAQGDLRALEVLDVFRAHLRSLFVRGSLVLVAASILELGPLAALIAALARPEPFGVLAFVRSARRHFVGFTLLLGVVTLLEGIVLTLTSLGLRTVAARAFAGNDRAVDLGLLTAQVIALIPVFALGITQDVVRCASVARDIGFYDAVVRALTVVRARPLSLAAHYLARLLCSSAAIGVALVVTFSVGMASVGALTVSALSQLAALFSLAALRVSWLSHVVRDESTVPIATRASEP